MKYLFFDLDGTLTDPFLGITNSIIYSLGKMGREAPPREALARFIGPPLRTGYKEFLGMTDEEAERGVVYYREYYSAGGLLENTLYNGIEELLRKLKDAGFCLCVATSKPEEFAVRILEHFDIAKYFTHICGASLDSTRTTKTAVIEYLLSKLEEDGTDDNEIRRTSVMIGDRHHDIDGAKDTGISSIGILWGYGSEEELRGAGADHIAADAAELEAIITNW